MKRTPLRMYQATLRIDALTPERAEEIFGIIGAALCNAYNSGEWGEEDKQTGEPIGEAAAFSELTEIVPVN